MLPAIDVSLASFVKHLSSDVRQWREAQDWVSFQQTPGLSSTLLVGVLCIRGRVEPTFGYQMPALAAPHVPWWAKDSVSDRPRATVQGHVHVGCSRARLLTREVSKWIARHPNLIWAGTRSG